jgi:hypothetical protein
LSCINFLLKVDIHGENHLKLLICGTVLFLCTVLQFIIINSKLANKIPVTVTVILAHGREIHKRNGLSAVNYQLLDE